MIESLLHISSSSSHGLVQSSVANAFISVLTPLGDARAWPSREEPQLTQELCKAEQQPDNPQKYSRQLNIFFRQGISGTIGARTLLLHTVWNMEVFLSAAITRAH